jgi:predicted phosphodiesterase
MLLLHISDIHFKYGEIGSADDPNRGLRNDMIHDVRYMRNEIGRDVDLILISGDTAYAGKAKEYEFAYDWLEKQLCPASGCKIENIFVVPGNHDVDVGVEAGPASVHARSSLRSLPPVQVDGELRKWLRDPSSSNLLFKPIENYNRFAAKFLCSIGGYQLNEEGKQIENSTQPFTTRDLTLDDGSTLRLWGFNSVLVSDLSDNKDKMLMDPAASQIEREDGVVHLVMCHHPFGWLRNGRPFEDRINSVAKIQLFGHEHTQRVEEGKHYTRIRAGALQPARDETDWKPGYNWINISANSEGETKRSLTVRIHVRMHENDHFLAVTDPHNNSDVWEDHFELPPWRRSSQAPQAVAASHEEKVVPELKEGPMATPETPVNLRTVTLKIFRLKEHEQRRLIVKMSLDREGDSNLRDYEIAINAVRRAADSGILSKLDEEIDALLSKD